MNAFCEHHKDSVRFGYRCFDRTEARSGWHHIDAGPHLEILFHPNRRLAGREPDQIERPSIVIAVAGKREQALRFDLFSMGAHYHIRPGLAEQIHSRSQRGKLRSRPLWHSSKSRFGSGDSSHWPRRTRWRRNCAMKS
jgi:hypothetical protein